MPYAETMTLDEKLAIGCKAAELRRAGDKEGARRLLRTAPLPPYLAKVVKQKVGLNVLLSTGWNMSEVEAEFGKEWLSKQYPCAQDGYIKKQKQVFV